MLYGFLDEDLRKVLQVYERIREAAKLAFEREKSLSYLVGKAFGGILSDEDITKTIARADGVNNTMVEMLGAFNRLRPGPSPQNNLFSFAKKNLK